VIPVLVGLVVAVLGVLVGPLVVVLAADAAGRASTWI